MKWTYKNRLLKDYLRKIIKNKKNLNYLYFSIRQILEKEYDEVKDLDLLIEDILNRDKIKKIINDEYEKKEKKTWTYKNRLLKDYLKEIIKDKKDLEYLYKMFRRELQKEYDEAKDLDLLVENILNRDKFKKIIDGSYVKNKQENWYYKNMRLSDYIKQNINSEYRTLREIRANIEDNVMLSIKNNNLPLNERENLVDEYINSEKFKYFLENPRSQKLSYYYKNIKLRKYLSININDKNNLDYIYQLICSKIRYLYELDDKNIDDIVDEVMASDEVIYLINSKNIKKKISEIWPYKEGLLKDYLKTLYVDSDKVYNHIRDNLNRKYPNGFISIEEKRKKIEEYIESNEFKTYLKYGHKDKKFYYDNMLLIDYLKENYAEILKNNNKNVENLYKKIIYCLSKYDINNLSIEEINKLINKIINSEEIDLYLSKTKQLHETYIYKNLSLKDAIAKYYKQIINSTSDLDKIYRTFISYYKYEKEKDINKSMNEIFKPYFEKEYIKNFSINYIKKIELQKEVLEKNKLYENMNDINYINTYLKNRKIKLREINRIKDYGFSYYASIMIYEYSKKYDEKVIDLIKYTKNINLNNNNDLIWLLKLGYKNYAFDLIEKNKKLINIMINKSSYRILSEPVKIDYEEIYNYLNNVLLKKYVTFTVSKENSNQSFNKFCSSCIEKYILQYKREKLSNIIYDEDIYFELKSTENIEENYLDGETKKIVYSLIDELTDIEKEFVYLRYGFYNYPHNLNEINEIFESNNIKIDINHLEQKILDKLRKNSKVLTLK